MLLLVLWNLTAWNAELRLGQNNVLGLGLVMLSWNGGRPLLSAVGITLAVLLKPTLFLFFPWALRAQRRPGLFLASALSSALLLLLVFVVSFGWERCLSLHREWLAFLGPSAEKHLGRLDNYGLPSLFGYSSLGSILFFVSSLGLALWHGGVSGRGEPAHLRALALGGILVLLVSPMTWLQNFVLLLPYTALLWANCHKPRAAVALALLYGGVQLVNPTICATGICESFPHRLPLWTLIAALLVAGLFGDQVREKEKEREVGKPDSVTA